MENFIAAVATPGGLAALAVITTLTAVLVKGVHVWVDGLHDKRSQWTIHK